jgi:Flp pilus assembly protein protease CpaA
MTETPLDEPELPPSLRLLKRLVTVLTVTMIVGVITVVGLLVTRMPQFNAQPDLPATLTLPDGAMASAVTMGTGWIAVVTTDNRIMIFDKLGQLLQVVTIDLPAP